MGGRGRGGCYAGGQLCQKNWDGLCENAVWTSPKSGRQVRTCHPDSGIWTAMYLDLDQLWTKSGPNLESWKNRLDQFRQPPIEIHYHSMTELEWKRIKDQWRTWWTSVSSGRREFARCLLRQKRELEVANENDHERSLICGKKNIQIECFDLVNFMTMCVYPTAQVSGNL